MLLTPSKINLFLALKLPSAYFCGVRVKSISKQHCEVTVTHKWINQNPFKSLYFAVQAMAAELSTGALVMSAIKESGTNIAMLVVQHNSEFTKKATGKITFSCYDGDRIASAIAQTIASGEGQQVVLRSVGMNQAGEQVSSMEFHWSIKIKR